MTRQSRRTFLASASLLTLGANAIAMSDSTSKSKLPSKSDASSQEKSFLVHHVFFWLKNPKSEEDRDKLVEGVKSLAGIESVRKLHVGIPAATEARKVVDASYAVTELIFFDDIAGQNIYQDHPIHKKFVDEHSHLWKKVIVYDSTTL